MSDPVTQGVGRTIVCLFIAVLLLLLAPFIGIAFVGLLIWSGFVEERVLPWLEEWLKEPNPPEQREFPFDEIVDQPGR